MHQHLVGLALLLGGCHDFESNVKLGSDTCEVYERSEPARVAHAGEALTWTRQGSDSPFHFVVTCGAVSRSTTVVPGVECTYVCESSGAMSGCSADTLEKETIAWTINLDASLGSGSSECQFSGPTLARNHRQAPAPDR